MTGLTTYIQHYIQGSSQSSYTYMCLGSWGDNKRHSYGEERNKTAFVSDLSGHDQLQIMQCSLQKNKLLESNEL